MHTRLYLYCERLRTHRFTQTVWLPQQEEQGKEEEEEEEEEEGCDPIYIGICTRIYLSIVYVSKYVCSPGSFGCRSRSRKRRRERRGMKRRRRKRRRRRRRSAARGLRSPLLRGASTPLGTARLHCLMVRILYRYR